MYGLRKQRISDLPLSLSLILVAKGDGNARQAGALQADPVQYLDEVILHALTLLCVHGWQT